MEGGSSGVVTDSDGNQYGTDVSYDFGDDLISAFSLGLKVQF
jgi:long-chain fatty acid transport protein